jgi:hypothetical protein
VRFGGNGDIGRRAEWRFPAPGNVSFPPIVAESASPALPSAFENRHLGRDGDLHGGDFHVFVYCIRYAKAYHLGNRCARPDKWVDDVEVWEEGMQLHWYVERMTLAALGTVFAAGMASASDNRIAVVPGGPHPYFAPWELGAADAKKEFGIASVDYKVPAEWKLDLQTGLLESLVTQGYKGFGIFPGDPVGVNSSIKELKEAGVVVAALGGCTVDPTDAAFCFATDPFNTSYLQAKETIKAMGGKGNLVHLTGQLIDKNNIVRV